MAGEISRPAVAEPARFRVMTLRFLVIAFAILTGSAGRSAESNHDAAAQADEPPKLKFSDFPRRPRPLIELGDKFLSEGNLRKGFTLPTGAVWTPNLWVYGNFRSAVQSFDSGAAPRSSECVNRLDLFGNLELSPTERVVIGIRPFDHKGDFTGFNFEPATRRGFEENFNATSFQPRTLFFEGEFGEIFPGLDDGDRLSLDYGISVGRQPLRDESVPPRRPNSATIFRSRLAVDRRFVRNASCRCSGLIPRRTFPQTQPATDPPS